MSQDVKISVTWSRTPDTWLHEYEELTLHKILILTNEKYFGYDGGWIELDIVGDPVDQDFLDYGVDKVIEIDQIEQIYNLFENNIIELIYFTDDVSKEEAELEITANYSPLDELEGDFEVVTWTDEADGGRLVELKGIPKPQFVYQTTPNDVLGYLEKLKVTEGDYSEDDGTVRYLISSNKKTWKAWSGSSFVNVNTSNIDDIVDKGMSLEDIDNVVKSEWETWTGGLIYIATYINESPRSKLSPQVESITMRSLEPSETTRVSDAKLYILNTVSTIDVSFAGSTLTGTIDDADEGKVQYRVLLNGENYFPADGSFTPLMASPLNISTTLSNDDILIDENNNLRIEFQDYWGAADYWETNFTGTYSGLLFMDETGEYYSNDIGEVLQYLDFGIIIAGQTTLEQKIALKNTYGYTVNNVNIRANSSEFPSGMKAQFGTGITTFEALDELLLPANLEDGESTEFYIRLTTQLGVTAKSEGMFDIIVTADKVE